MININNNFNFHADKVEVSPFVTLALTALIVILYLDHQEKKSKLATSKRGKKRKG